MPGVLILLMGRSFSGKSTLAATLSSALPATVVSHDAINEERGLHGGDGIPVEEWARTAAIAHGRVQRLLGMGETVVVDDTSSPRFLRDEWRGLAETAASRFLLVFIDAEASLLRRRLLDNRTSRQRLDVRDEVMDEHLASFEPPEADEPHVHLRSAVDADEAISEIRRHSAQALPSSSY